MRPFSPFVLVGLVFINLPISHCSAQFGAPELQALAQLGAMVGQPLPPTANSVGQNLAGTRFELSDYGFQADSIPADADPGIYQVRALGPHGLSNSRSFLVTSEPWSIVAANESEVNPSVIAPGTVWQDECPERGRNYYRIKVRQDQKLTLKTFAYSLDSRARLVVSLLNSDRTTLGSVSATNDCDANMILDLQPNIEYTLIVHDHLFRGGADYRYALMLSTMPTDALDEIGFVERWKNMARQVRNNSNEPLLPSSPWHPRAALLRSPSDAAIQVHDETRFAENKPMPIVWPAIVSGRWDANDDLDIFDIECEAKTDVSVEVVSQRLGEWTDGLLVVSRLENSGQPTEKVSRIVENDDGPAIGNAEMRFLAKDPIVTFQTTEKGTYRLQVRSQQRLDKTKPAPRYALEIRKPNPGFVLGAHFSHPTLALDQSRTLSPTLCAGGAAMISVHAMRFDNFNEPIEVSLQGLSPGVRGGSCVIAKDQNVATLNLWNFGPPTNPNASPKIDRLEIVGTVEIGQQSITMPATALEVTWNAIDTYRSPIAKWLRSFNAIKLETTVCPITLELGPKELDARFPIRMDAMRGQTLKIPVRVTRRTGGEGTITVRLHHGPPKATMAEFKIDAKASEGVLELVVPKDAPVGEYMLGALGETAVTIPNSDPAAKEKSKSITLQLPTSNVRVRIGDAP